MSEKKKRIREKIGQVFQIPLGEGTFGYGQIADVGTSVFFDYKDDGIDPDIHSIISSAAVFITGLDDYVIKEQVWPVLGIFSINPEFKKDYDLFSYDYVAKTYILWTMRSGKLEQIKVSWEEIKDLECFASWSHDHVEQRLRDHFAGRPNFDVENFRNQHIEGFPGITEFYKQYGYDFKLPESFDKK